MPENGASTVRSARSASACASLRLRLRRLRFRRGDRRLLLGNLRFGAGNLRDANFRIVQVCLRGGQRAARRFHLALRGGHHGGLLVGLHFGLQSLLLGSGAGFRQPRVGIAVEFREPQRRLLLDEVRFRGRQVRLRLPDAALRIHRRLAGLQLILAQLVLQHGDLIARALHFCLRVGERGPRLIFFRAHLRIVEPRDHLAGRYGVAFAHGDFENFPAGFRRHRGIVAFNASAERNDAGRKIWRGKKYFPDHERGDDHSHDEQDHRDARARRLVFRRRRRAGCGRRRSALLRAWRRLRQRVGFHFIHGVFRAPLSSSTRAKNPRCGPRCGPVDSA